jgi:hypothetical protein
MSCEIIQFSTTALSARTDAAKLSPAEACKNQRLRDGRRDGPRQRIAVFIGGRSLIGISALGIAQDCGIADAHRFPPANNESRLSLVDTWRAALVKQLLTPAPDAGAVAWKRTQVRAENYRCTDVKPERIERAIADDVAFLEAHTRRAVLSPRCASLQSRSTDEAPAPIGAERRR